MKSIWDLCDATLASPLYYLTGLVAVDPQTHAKLSYTSSGRSFVLRIPNQPKHYIRTQDESKAIARAARFLPATAR